MSSEWVGRFAPSPSGSLHFGSLIAALSSYLIAKHQQGEWLVRIEDIDPPREVAGAADSILSTLEAFGFKWDRQEVFQSQRFDYYQAILEKLNQAGITYLCDCSRRDIQERNSGIYDSYCRNRNIDSQQEHAIRVRFEPQFSYFKDAILGDCCFDKAEDLQDFIIFRRDKQFAYQLAVVADDIEQGVNHVVRGADILDSTPRQNYLYHYLKQQAPIYYHVPLAVDEFGVKLSKRSYATPIKPKDASKWLVKALRHLGQKVNGNLIGEPPEDVLKWGIENWQVSSVPKQSVQV
jgi:glutamyl-Q tRNA(Asp) synthetase